MTVEYRKANELADLVDFYEGATTAEDKRILEEFKTELAEQEGIDGCPADPKEVRRGFFGAT
jgi:hypothetical protein